MKILKRISRLKTSKAKLTGVTKTSTKKNKSKSHLVFASTIKTKSGRIIEAKKYGLSFKKRIKTKKSGTDDTGPRVR